MALDHRHYMNIALERARAAGARGDRPIASIIVREGEILGIAENTMFSDFDPTAHAEIAAIRQVCARLETVELAGSTLYSTLEPCPMCLWAMLEARIETLVMGGTYAGLGRTDLGQYNVQSFLTFADRSLEIVTGVLQGECEQVRREWGPQPSAR